MAVEPLMKEVRVAMDANNAEGVRTAVARAISALGKWAGVPETSTTYFPPTNSKPFDIPNAKRWWQAEIARHLDRLPWRRNPSGDPKEMSAGLRDAAIPLDALARTALLYPDERDQLIEHVRAGADWLVKLQHPSGVFPFPVGPALRPKDKVGHLVARMIKKNPEMVINDWIPDDLGDGGLQFDNGLCGRALISAWELTREPRYLAAACKAGDWAAKIPIVPNWNYNAFSVGLLSRLATSTGDLQYLELAIKKADVGVLPGQMPSGRWFDPHNACAVYHNILLRELLELFHALPQDHPFRETLRDAIARGLNQAAEETLSKGFTGTWTEIFARGLQWIGEERKWRKAMNINLNASGKNKAPSPGAAIITVLEALDTSR